MTTQYRPPLEVLDHSDPAWLQWFELMQRYREVEPTESLAGHIAASDPHTQYLTQTEGDALYHPLNFGFKSANSVTLTAGTSTSTVNDLQTMLDGNVYHIDEDAATPGYDLEVVFTSVTKIRGVQARFYYDGSSTHVMQLELRNYTSSAWDVLHTVNGATGSYQTIFFLLPSDVNYVSGGEAKVRFNHVSAGNSSHNMDIDYVGLVS